MKPILRISIVVCGLAAGTALASAPQPVERSIGTAAPADQLRLSNEYRLVLRDAAAFKLGNSSTYRLQGPWARREITPPEPPAARDPPPLPSPTLSRPFHAEVAKAAKEAGLEPALVHAVIRTESAYRSHAISPKGAVGLMQLIPDTARRYGVSNATNPLENIRGGTRYLSDLLRMFGGNVTLALAAYNAGEGAVMRYGGVPRYAETRQYIPRVLAEYDRLRNTAIVSATPPIVR